MITQTAKPFELGREYSVSGVIAVAVAIKSYSGLLSGVQRVYLDDGMGKTYKLTRWPDGTIYRINRA
jgi:hypothetical protein